MEVLYCSIAGLNNDLHVGGGEDKIDSVSKLVEIIEANTVERLWLYKLDGMFHSIELTFCLSITTISKAHVEDCSPIFEALLNNSSVKALFIAGMLFMQLIANYNRNVGCKIETNMTLPLLAKLSSFIAELTFLCKFSSYANETKHIIHSFIDVSFSLKALQTIMSALGVYLGKIIFEGLHKILIYFFLFFFFFLIFAFAACQIGNKELQIIVTALLNSTATGLAFIGTWKLY